MMMRVLEIDLAAFAVFHVALVEDLEEEFQHVGVRFFDFVEQHDGVGPAADGFGEDAAFAVADVAREANPSGWTRCALPGTRTC